MGKRVIDPQAIARDEDWVGNNAAFNCPFCGKLFIVSHQIHKEGRDCPVCGKSRGYALGGQKSGGQAWIEWGNRLCVQQGGAPLRAASGARVTPDVG